MDEQDWAESNREELDAIFTEIISKDAQRANSVTSNGTVRSTASAPEADAAPLTSAILRMPEPVFDKARVYAGDGDAAFGFELELLTEDMLRDSEPEDCTGLGDEAGQDSSASTNNDTTAPCTDTMSDSDSETSSTPNAPGTDGGVHLRGNLVNYLEASRTTVERAGEDLAETVYVAFHEIAACAKMLWFFLQPILTMLLNTFGRILVFLILIIYVLPAILRLNTTKKFVCDIPIFGNIARYEGFYCPASTTSHAVVMYKDLHNSLATVAESTIQLQSQSSSFIMAKDSMMDASRDIKLCDYPGASQTGEMIAAYGRNISAVGWGMSTYYNNLTFLMENMAINLNQVVLAMGEAPENTSLSTIFIKSGHSTIDAMKLYTEYALRSLKSLTDHGNECLMNMTDLDEQWNKVEDRRALDLLQVERNLSRSWTIPSHLWATAWHREQLRSMKVLQEVQILYTGKARAFLNEMNEHLRDVLGELSHLWDILGGAHGYVKDEAMIQQLWLQQARLHESASVLRKNREQDKARVRNGLDLNAFVNGIA